jgi:hypothetical protein
LPTVSDDAVPVSPVPAPENAEAVRVPVDGMNVSAVVVLMAWLPLEFDATQVGYTEVAVAESFAVPTFVALPAVSDAAVPLKFVPVIVGVVVYAGVVPPTNTPVPAASIAVVFRAV